MQNIHFILKGRKMKHMLMDYSQLHTDLGDMKLEIFCESVPKTAEVKSIYLTDHHSFPNYKAALADFSRLPKRISLHYAPLPFMMDLPSIAAYLAL